MFTGIVEELGTVQRLKRTGDKIKIQVAARTVLEDVQTGDSIDTNGVCLTVVSYGENYFTADMMASTAEKSGLDQLKVGSKVNLERAVTPTTRLGGHILQGHVDCKGTVGVIEPLESGYLLEVLFDSKFAPLVVSQGSIGLNGVSLTIYKLTERGVMVSLIPETLNRTNLPDLKTGDTLTVEFDIVGKYIRRNFEVGEMDSPASHIDREFLAKYGF